MLIFRDGTQEDIKHIAKLEAENFADAWSCTSIGETLAQKNAFVGVVEQANAIVGYCIVYYVMDEAEITRIAVGETVRRQGVGRGLLDYVCKCCEKRQIERVLLDVRESNSSARSFYEHYGFGQDGVRKNFYENPKEDGILMSLVLP